MVYKLIELGSQGELGEGGGKVVDGLVECVGKEEEGEGEREVV